MELIKFVLKMMENIEKLSQEKGQDMRDTFLLNIDMECTICPFRKECHSSEREESCSDFLRRKLTV